MEQKKVLNLVYSIYMYFEILNLVKVLVYESCTAAVGLNAAVNLFFFFLQYVLLYGYRRALY